MTKCMHLMFNALLYAESYIFVQIIIICEVLETGDFEADFLNVGCLPYCPMNRVKSLNSFTPYIIIFLCW